MSLWSNGGSTGGNNPDKCYLHSHLQLPQNVSFLLWRETKLCLARLHWDIFDGTVQRSMNPHFTFQSSYTCTFSVVTFMFHLHFCQLFLRRIGDFLLNNGEDIKESSSWIMGKFKEIFGPGLFGGPGHDFYTYLHTQHGAQFIPLAKIDGSYEN